MIYLIYLYDLHITRDLQYILIQQYIDTLIMYRIVILHKVNIDNIDIGIFNWYNVLTHKRKRLLPENINIDLSSYMKISWISYNI